jgi:hypothetical protein
MGDFIEAAIAVALTKLGAPYVWATAGPDTFDCSGFTWWVACQILGPQDPELRSSHHQFNVWGNEGDGSWVMGDRGGAETHHPTPITHHPTPGDLVFFNTTGAVVFGNLASHVGLMIDAERFIHAANEQLGVRIDSLRGGWYEPRFIGAGRIVAEGGEVAGSPGRRGNELEHPATSPPRHLATLVVPAGPIRTPNPWNGGSFGAGWNDIGRWAAELEAAARERRLDVRLPAAVMALETQGIHQRRGQVIEVWDSHPADGPSVGLMQVKPWVWQYLVPTADAYEPAGNIRLGVAVLAHLIARYGSWVRAIAEGYHPGVSSNGTTPSRYVAAIRGLLGELGYAT